ncbi:glycosyltransferase family 2 protein [Flavobacterium chungbukense]|uniref:Glycosyltransferase family 2 protein n=1 Tax=Flavobacterium chungbukense TaxID=877464 RepID=A0ABP7XKM2_9FLAO|nr:glycosyltransferase family 2 protein [Flavobacterium chungbukense]MCC4922966.1 glycosyltransferase [Flavobacterium chungbukense]
MLLTIFTPTYNRAYTLQNLYKSLLNQTCNDFEWLIIDDGSIDDTKQLVDVFIHERKLNINYIKTLNRGKHIAINKGVEEAKGELFFIVDSDDELPQNSVCDILLKYKKIQEDKNIAGVIGRRGYKNNTIIGNKGDYNELITNAIGFRYLYKISGDMAEVVKTEVLKNYKFPSFENEKFCPESLVWNRIALNYDFLWFNEVVYNCEYLEDGLTSNSVKIRMNSPNSSMLYYSELAKYKIPFKEKSKAVTNYWRFSFNTDFSIAEKFKNVSFLLSLFCMPLGYLMYKKDKSKI